MTVIIRGTTLKCSKHPNYRAAHQPQAQCNQCWELYELSNLNDRIDQDMDDLLAGVYHFAKENA